MRLSARRFVAAASFAVLVALATTTFLQAIRAADPQDGAPDTPPITDHAMPGHDEMPGMMQHRQQMMNMHADHAAHMTGSTPILPGQDAFGAIQEIVRVLDADPKTDWSKVNLEALRQHLIDMNDVTLKADVTAKSIDGGLEIAVTGNERTVQAIQRMVPAHAHEIDKNSSQWLERQDRSAAERRYSHCHFRRPEGGAAHSRPRFHRHPGERLAPSGASPRHGQRRVRSHALNRIPTFDPKPPPMIPLGRWI